MHARVSTLTPREGQMDLAIGVCRDQALPALERQEGFLGYTLMADHETSTILSTTFWESEADMAASERGVYLQEQISRILPVLARPPEIRRYEVELLS